MQISQRAPKRVLTTRKPRVQQRFDPVKVRCHVKQTQRISVERHFCSVLGNKVRFSLQKLGHLFMDVDKNGE